MKKSFCGFLAVFFLILNIIPFFKVYADSGYSDSQYEDIGSLILGSMLSNGEATELDFSDYTGDGTDLLIAIGEMAVSGDVTGLVELGLDWLGGVIDDTYQSLIDSIKQWEYRVSPDLYNFWYNGENIRIDTFPNKRESRNFSNILIDHNTSTTIPDLFQSWCSIISGYGVGTDNISIKEPFANPGQYYWDIIFPFSFVSYNLYTNESTIQRNIAYYDVGTLYINTTNDNRFHLTSQGFNPRAILHHGSTQWSQSNQTFYEYSVDLWSAFAYQGNISSYIEDSYYNDLSSCMIYILNKYRHINLIVDGDQWIDLGYEPSYPIQIPNVVTVLNNLPAQYTYPPDTFIDLSNLKTILINAIRSSDVVLWSDIEDVFVDVNGQTAVAVLQVHENNYDEMYLWQYPNILLPSNGDNYSVFNPNILNEVSNNLNVPIDIVDNTVDILPSDIVGVLAIGGILTIFACIIHRLLE